MSDQARLVESAEPFPVPRDRESFYDACAEVVRRHEQIGGAS